MKTGTNIRSKELFLLNYSARPKKNILVMPKVFLRTKNSEKPFFSNKGLNTNKMILVEDNEIVLEKEIMPNIMNNYFINITTHLKVKLSKIDPKTNLESIIDTSKMMKVFR